MNESESYEGLDIDTIWFKVNSCELRDSNGPKVLAFVVIFI